MSFLNIIHCFDRNALRQIEEIRILRSYELSMSAVQHLIEACPKLRLVAITVNHAQVLFHHHHHDNDGANAELQNVTDMADISV